MPPSSFLGYATARRELLGCEMSSMSPTPIATMRLTYLSSFIWSGEERRGLLYIGQRAQAESRRRRRSRSRSTAAPQSTTRRMRWRPCLHKLTAHAPDGPELSEGRVCL